MNGNQTATATPTLIFIPDISGFTHFVSRTEISHSQHIIAELLEVLIDSNEIGLELSEIEGDALFFYRHGPAPTVTELLAQIERMYINFHSHLKKYEAFRICSCGACSSATSLRMKCIAHYGEVIEKKVKDHLKLFGKDVIVAHRLLKNQVPIDEYGLFSDELSEACVTWDTFDGEAWSEVAYLQEDYDFGSASYCYLPLRPLAARVPEPTVEDYSIDGATKKLFETESVIEAPIDLTFSVVSDYHFRPEFVAGQKGSDMQNHEIFQNGSTHRCILEQGPPQFFITHDFAYANNTIRFVETDQKNGIVSVWTLTAESPTTTRVSLVNFMKPNPLKVLMFNLFLKKKISRSLQESWALLNDYCISLFAENRPHPNTLVLPDIVTMLP